MTGRRRTPDRAGQGQILPILLALLLLPAVGLESQSPNREAADAADPAVPVTDALLRAGHSGDPSHWPTYGGNLGQRRYSPLEQIDTTNVDRLRPAWIYQTGVAATTEATPVIVGSALYLSTPAREDGTQHVIRLDARTGQEVWRTAVEPPRASSPQVGVNRGVAVYGEKVYLTTANGRLVALDSGGGDILWSVDTGSPRLTHAPVAFGGKIFAGSSGTPKGIRGFVRAFDAETGDRLWTWHSIPSPEQGGWWGEWTEHLPGRPDLSLNRDLERERADSARYADAWRRGGGPIWMTPTLDPERGLLFVSVAAAFPEFDGSVRPGDNLWSNSVCAVRAETGTKEWCFQVVPHDRWNMDVASPPFLFEMEHGGKRVPAVGQFPKLGALSVWDRESGEHLIFSENYVPWKNLFRPLASEGEPAPEVAPGYYGGTDWSPGAYHPGTGYAYTAAIHKPGTYYLAGSPPPDSIGDEGWQGGHFEPTPGADHGVLAAVDPTTGEVAWKARTPEPMIGGVLATAGGLVFAGRLGGSFDAWHATTGEHLWRFPAGAGCASAPATYRLDGTQYLVVSCGGHFLGPGTSGDAIVAFTLPEGG